ncbi:MAG: pantoate--beta-alanine ligase [Actinobacteria bacterium]|nr:pantoate--beta-alanine ligase [Actinomycetota bacterium]
MRVVGTFAGARSLRAGITGLVPTMGYLHEGHLSLVGIARERSDTVMASLFVNPLQFDDPSDLDRYPRDFDRDAALLESAGCDVLFAPQAAEVYPAPPLARVVVSGLTDTMEGPRRPGHFDGVVTVVAKLLGGLQPDLAVFGRKDAQQLVVVARLAADLSMPVEVIGGPTIREADGLALSSRNVFLSGEERRAALGISRGVMAAADAAEAGERSGAALEGLVIEEMSRQALDIEYAELADAADTARLLVLDRPAFLAVAAGSGRTRLIDNVWLKPDGTADRGARLGRPSVLYGGGD